MPTLDWLNRAEALTIADKVPYRVLEPVADYGAGAEDNLLIQGDNLEHGLPRRNALSPEQGRRTAGHQPCDPVAADARMGHCLNT